MQYINIDNIEIDIEALRSIDHTCQPGLCKKDQCCCSRYEICIDPDELQKIISYMPEASEYAPDLKEGSGYANIFTETEDDLLTIDMDDQDFCCFTYSGGKNEFFCSLHTIALNSGLPPIEVKPRSCVTWPLAITDEKPVLLSITEDAFEFPCNSPRSDNSSIHPNIEAIICDVFGEKFLEKIKTIS
ncbi:MAG: hypothetical protein ISR96_03360 [Nitrospira sp.]|nr:hypothetical protein [bacterium]MBL7048553.1 hypothetical protein [Nitrospira sp.]